MWGWRSSALSAISSWGSLVGPTHWQVRAGAEYGIYVEMGTRHMAAQPYLTPAAEFVRAGFLRAMRTVVEP